MNQMIERVAEAIRKSGPLDCYEGYEQAARAAIKAMSEPTQEMVDAVDLSIPTEGQIIDVWSTMIDTALKC